MRVPRLNDDTTQLADWLEYEALRSENGIGSAQELATALAIGATGDALDDEIEEPRTFSDHGILDDVMLEIERRKVACDDASYPFTLDPAGSSITLRERWEISTYIFLLLLSDLPASGRIDARGKTHFHARLFERLSVSAARVYLGGASSRARSFHFAFPRPDGSSFSQALAQLIKETTGDAQGLLSPENEKDDKLDVFAWAPFPDRESNFISLFGQCASGDDWDEKLPHPEAFFHPWLKLNSPTAFPALFVPFVLSPRDFAKKGQAAIFIDRCRLAALVPETRQMADLGEDFGDWIQAQRKHQRLRAPSSHSS